jgi:heme-degrading monooxygenase HmoA
MHARTGVLQVKPDKVDDAVRALEAQLPSYRNASGYKGFTCLADRKSGKVLGISFWASEADRQASEELGAQARQSMQDAGLSQKEPVREEWEVALDDMP